MGKCQAHYLKNLNVSYTGKYDIVSMLLVLFLLLSS